MAGENIAAKGAKIMPEQDKMVNVLNWCASVLGPVEVVADHGRSRPEDCASVCQIQTCLGTGYIKMHSAMCVV